MLAPAIRPTNRNAPRISGWGRWLGLRRAQSCSGGLPRSQRQIRRSTMKPAISEEKM